MANEGKGQHRDTHVVVVVRRSSATSTGVRVQCPCAQRSVQSLVSVAHREVRRRFDMRVETDTCGIRTVAIVTGLLYL
jgi:hypothetical protein